MNTEQDLVRSAWSLRECFKQLRFDENHHLESGDIRLTIAQQEEICDLVETEHNKSIDRIENRLKKWEDSLTAVMPPDCKDWHENSPAEWPEVAAALIVNLRKDRDLAWEMTNKIVAKNEELQAQNERIKEIDGINKKCISALGSLLPGAVLDLRYADENEDKEALRTRIETIKDALAAAKK